MQQQIVQPLPSLAQLAWRSLGPKGRSGLDTDTASLLKPYRTLREHAPLVEDEIVFDSKREWKMIHRDGHILCMHCINLDDIYAEAEYRTIFSFSKN